MATCLRSSVPSHITLDRKQITALSSVLLNSNLYFIIFFHTYFPFHPSQWFPRRHPCGVVVGTYNNNCVAVYASNKCKCHSIHQEGKYEKLRFGKCEENIKWQWRQNFLQYFLASKRTFAVCTLQSIDNDQLYALWGAAAAVAKTPKELWSFFIESHYIHAKWIATIRCRNRG